MGGVQPSRSKASPPNSEGRLDGSDRSVGSCGPRAPSLGDPPHTHLVARSPSLALGKLLDLVRRHARKSACSFSTRILVARSRLHVSCEVQGLMEGLMEDESPQAGLEKKKGAGLVAHTKNELHLHAHTHTQTKVAALLYCLVYLISNSSGSLPSAWISHILEKTFSKFRTHLSVSKSGLVILPASSLCTMRRLYPSSKASLHAISS